MERAERQRACKKRMELIHLRHQHEMREQFLKKHMAHMDKKTCKWRKQIDDHLEQEKRIIEAEQKMKDEEEKIKEAKIRQDKERENTATSVPNLVSKAK